MRLAMVGNPTAGSGRGAALAAATARHLRAAGHEVLDPHPKSAADASSIMGRLIEEESIAAMVVVGGDGMAHLGVNACVRTGTPLGVVPAGSGNDFGRMLQLPVHRPAEAVQRIIQALDEPKHIDAVRFSRDDGSSGWFAVVLAAGFDAVVNERANRWRFPRGRAKYPLATLRELSVFRPLRYRLIVDGVAETRTAMLVALANAPCYGGGMQIAPNSLPDDGLLDLVVVDEVPRTELLRILPTVYSGGHLRHPAVSVRRVHSARIEAAGVIGYADGERLGALPLDCRVVPGVLRVLA